MAITKTIEIGVDSSKAVTDVDKLVEKVDELGQQADKNLKSINKNVENIEKSTGTLAKGFKAAGLALKAMGIGLLISAFNILKDLFMSNQKIADGFGTSIKALSIVFNDLFNFIFDNLDSVKDFFKAIFEDPIGSLKQLGQLIKENIIERFTSALEVAGFLSDALVKLFKGDFEGALDSVKEAGKEMVDVFTGVDDTVGKVGDLADAVGKYAGEVWNSAAALQAQENAAKRAEAIQAGLVEQYDRQAEKLRQIRDNDLISIKDRIKANEELGKVLDEQEKAMLKQAQLQVQAAANQYNLNKSIENEVALIQARNNVKGVEAQIEGFRSEQKSNEIALNKELIDLTKAKQEAENTLFLEQKKFINESEKDTLKKLDTEREILEEEKRIELERLQFNIDSYKEGTQARLDAQIEFNTKKQELDNALITNTKQRAEEEIAVEQAVTDAKLALQNQALDTAANGIGVLKGLFEKNKGLQKAALIAESAIGISKIVINTQAANSAAKLKYAALPGGAALAAAEITLNKISAGIGIAANLAATAKGLSALGGGSAKGGSVGGDSSGGASAPTPQFNVVGNSGVNQIAQTLGQQQPVQAYVVANNVTTAQSLDRNIINNATLGG
jgi:hypothetical protein